MIRFATLTLALGAMIVPCMADNNGFGNGQSCAGLPSDNQLKALLKAAPATGPGNTHNPDAGGLFHGDRMWGAVVNRDGKICSFATNQDDPTQVWPGSQAIAKAKAYTANAFSLDSLALSTARLYTFTQPGHSLWSLGQSNPFDPKFLAAPGSQGGGDNQIAGGLIFFGGGVPLYKNGKIIGGLGVSGDTSCTDHEIAKRVPQRGRPESPPGGFGRRHQLQRAGWRQPLYPSTMSQYVAQRREAGTGGQRKPEIRVCATADRIIVARADGLPPQTMQCQAPAHRRAPDPAALSISRFAASSTPLMNCTDSSPEYRRASSIASSIATGGGVSSDIIS